MRYKIEGDRVLFSLSSTCEHLYLIGTFTNWKLDEGFRFEKSGDVCRLTKYVNEVNKIGNSGFIEYVIWNEVTQAPVDIENFKNGYCFNNQSNGGLNQLLFLEKPSECQLKEISEASKQSFIIKNQKSHFSSDYQFANFRPVIGGKLKPDWLFRSYHPVTPSRANHSELKMIEPTRQEAVMALIEHHQIHSVINLSDNEAVLADSMLSAPDSYYKQRWQAGSIHSVPVSYETVYFMSDRNEALNHDELGFEDGIRRLIAVVAEHEGPYLVHCRLGSDRTGVTCAFFQLLMGASKQEIADNYLKTNQLGIGEYRSFRLLERALQAAMGDDCFSDSVQKVKAYLKRLNIPEELIMQAKANLSGLNSARSA
ncbi:tyrosine-protein phosphatase [Photobacterium sp. ZSDE20]|uniref:Tyrosine-protein phosphatase n=1 Tax=Photobacterium pectinilyticum TaxID=2906793 RepID=A0ABT1N7D8_9GAMM|nr:tyrosine-protein phosphatase [Photobacterium sp. ZSDE20]MCQ1060667.1 tyrosine-protein phosphatase [Photobacterium sp. ZSDE20]MDD1828234.1 tyrosine-protein phosphatase [Photobacterium sp. ZSDE20]